MVQYLKTAHTVHVPDRFKLERFKKSPDLGPRILFFSGGTALRSLSRDLINYTHNSIHLITPFDSGGSSAVLRKEFHMLSVGDIRNRLMALADQSVHGNPEIYRLFAHRFPTDAGNQTLLEQLWNLAEGHHELVSSIPDPMRKIIRNHLRYFLKKMPESLNLQGASIGNLIITGGYLNQGNHIDPVIFLFSKLVEVRGTVRPITSKDLQLAAELEDGTIVVGQHLITGKEHPPLKQAIKGIFLSDSEMHTSPVYVEIRQKVRQQIALADLICYPMGSFYSSLLANFLVKGVGDEIKQNHCAKVFIPNTSHDPESPNMSVADRVQQLLKYLKLSCKETETPGELLNLIIIDSAHGDYPGGIDVDAIKTAGIEVLDTDLVTDESKPYIDAKNLNQTLLSIM